MGIITTGRLAKYVRPNIAYKTIAVHQAIYDELMLDYIGSGEVETGTQTNLEVWTRSTVSLTTRERLLLSLRP